MKSALQSLLRDVVSDDSCDEDDDDDDDDYSNYNDDRGDNADDVSSVQIGSKCVACLVYVTELQTRDAI